TTDSTRLATSFLVMTSSLTTTAIESITLAELEAGGRKPDDGLAAGAAAGVVACAATWPADRAHSRTAAILSWCILALRIIWEALMFRCMKKSLCCLAAEARV